MDKILDEMSKFTDSLKDLIDNINAKSNELSNINNRLKTENYNEAFNVIERIHSAFSNEKLHTLDSSYENIKSQIKILLEVTDTFSKKLNNNKTSTLQQQAYNVLPKEIKESKIVTDRYLKGGKKTA